MESASAAHCFVRYRIEHSPVNGLSSQQLHFLSAKERVAVEPQFHALLPAKGGIGDPAFAPLRT
jgi:hypothetical protein